tara:strand:+ start:237 stop:608 length:372 start_codon:yes stop_codon:yes gene_type:complete
MKRRRINPVSSKQKSKNETWAKITKACCEELQYICQVCGHPGHRDDPEGYLYLDGHHIIPRRFGHHMKSNCLVVHRVGFDCENPCHRYADRKLVCKTDATADDIEAVLREYRQSRGIYYAPQK